MECSCLNEDRRKVRRFAKGARPKDSDLAGFSEGNGSDACSDQPISDKDTRIPGFPLHERQKWLEKP
jgi:hypothetical protein